MKWRSKQYAVNKLKLINTFQRSSENENEHDMHPWLWYWYQSYIFQLETLKVLITQNSLTLLEWRSHCRSLHTISRQNTKQPKAADCLFMDLSLNMLWTWMKVLYLNTGRITKWVNPQTQVCTLQARCWTLSCPHREVTQVLMRTQTEQVMTSINQSSSIILIKYIHSFGLLMMVVESTL